jgi:hypothetical protein
VGVYRKRERFQNCQAKKNNKQTNKETSKQTENKTKQKGLIQYIAFASECEAFYDSINKANSVA